MANGMGVTGIITSLTWTEEKSNSGSDDDDDMLDVKAEFSEVLWPWSG